MVTTTQNADSEALRALAAGDTSKPIDAPQSSTWKFYSNARYFQSTPFLPAGSSVPRAPADREQVIVAAEQSALLQKEMQTAEQQARMRKAQQEKEARAVRMEERQANGNGVGSAGSADLTTAGFGDVFKFNAAMTHKPAQS